MARFCPRCGAFADEIPVKVALYSVECQSCNGEFLETGYRTDADLTEIPKPPGDCRIELRHDADGNPTFLIPKVGFTGVHYAPLIFTVLWTFIGLCAIAVVRGFGPMFILPAVVLWLPTIAVAASAVNCLKQTQQVIVAADSIRVMKIGPLFRTTRSIPLADVTGVLIRRAPPLDPFNPGVFLVHLPDVKDAYGQIPVPAILHGHNETPFGEFLRDSEKRWLVWALKSIIFTKTGKAV